MIKLEIFNTKSDIIVIKSLDGIVIEKSKKYTGTFSNEEYDEALGELNRLKRKGIINFKAEEIKGEYFYSTVFHPVTTTERLANVSGFSQVYDTDLHKLFYYSEETDTWESIETNTTLEPHTTLTELNDGDYGVGGHENVAQVVTETRDPDTDDDDSDTGGVGYKVREGSLWVNTTKDITYQCVDASTGSADWDPVNIEKVENLKVVGKSGAEFTTVQSAVNACVCGDVVLIKPGEYTEDIDIIDKQVTLIGYSTRTYIREGANWYSNTIIFGSITINDNRGLWDADITQELKNLDIRTEDKPAINAGKVWGLFIQSCNLYSKWSVDTGQSSSTCKSTVNLYDNEGWTALHIYDSEIRFVSQSSTDTSLNASVFSVIGNDQELTLENCNILAALVSNNKQSIVYVDMDGPSDWVTPVQIRNSNIFYFSIKAVPCYFYRSKNDNKTREPYSLYNDYALIVYNTSLRWSSENTAVDFYLIETEESPNNYVFHNCAIDYQYLPAGGSYNIHNILTNFTGNLEILNCTMGIDPSRLNLSTTNATYGITYGDGSQYLSSDLITEGNLQANGSIIFDSQTISGVSTGATGNNYFVTKGYVDGITETKNADYTITDSDGIRTLLVVASASNVNINLPTAADNTNRIINIKLINNGSATYQMSITPESGETLDDYTNAAPLTEASLHTSYKIQADGSNWWII